jgi:RNA polymerase sigma factor (sigma-70 family)
MCLQVDESRDLVDDESLLAASARGERDAFAVFYRRHLAGVLSVLVAETGHRELAADLTAEVFAVALLRAGRYRAERSTAMPWLCAIARHKARDSLRRGRAERRARRRLGIPSEPAYDADLERVDELVSQAGTFEGLLEELPAAQRVAVRARVIEERSYPQIAAEVGSTEQAVRQSVSRALSRLRKHAKEME